MIFGRQPARWIGLIVTLIVGVVTTLQGDSLITDAVAGQITDVVHATAQLATLLAPLIAGTLISGQVTPVSDPALPIGTTVEVITPAGQPNKDVTLGRDLVAAEGTATEA